MEDPISVDRNRTAGDQNPNSVADNQIHTHKTPADDQDRRLQHLLSSVQNFAASRDSSNGDHHSPVSVHPLASSNSIRRPMPTDFFREVSLFNAHFGSEPERSRLAQCLPEYLRPGNLENYLKETNKPQLFGNNFWGTSQESSGQDCNSRLTSVNQRKMPLVPDEQKDLQSLKLPSQRNDHIRYSRDQLLHLREVKTISEAIRKIKQDLELDFFGLKQMLERGAAVVENRGTRRKSGVKTTKKKEEKKMTNIAVNAKQELKTRENTKPEMTNIAVSAKQELKTGENTKPEMTNIAVNAKQELKTGENTKPEMTNIAVNAKQELKTGENTKPEEVSKKRKRGNSDERKAKKKKKERLKRAEKNRKLGVTRLKIQPILKQKTVPHCRHYIMGRCTEGENCKFSHDVIPLTKSKACTHHARKSCMKGDDCPFDHDLSKYPCTKFESTGKCDRGDNCSFSHKITPRQDSVSEISTIKPETKSINPSPNSRNISLGSSAQQRLPNLSQKSPVAFEAGAPTFNGLFKGTPTSMTKSSAQPHQISTSKVNLPVKAPKGLNFLNTGNLQQNDSAKDTQLSNQGMISNVSNPSKVSETSSVLAPNLIDNVMFGKSSNNRMETKESSFPTFGNNISVISPGDKKDFGGRNSKQNAVPFKLPAFTSTSNSFLTKLGNASQVKNATSSGQRSLLSKLPFASKNCFGAKTNPFISTSAESGGSDLNSRSQQTESPKNVIPLASATSSSADVNNVAGSSSNSNTGHKKPADPLETFKMIFGGGS